MSDKYLSKDCQRAEEQLISSFEKDKKYSKKAAIIGGMGLIVTSGDYFISSKLGLDSLVKPFGEMNKIELVNNLLFIASSLTTLYGGVIYGASNFLERGLRQEDNKKPKKLEDSSEY